MHCHFLQDLNEHRVPGDLAFVHINNYSLRPDNDEPVFAVQNPTLVASRRNDLGNNGIATPLMWLALLPVADTT
jgi:hypothetical protein